MRNDLNISNAESSTSSTSSHPYSRPEPTPPHLFPLATSELGSTPSRSFSSSSSRPTQYPPQRGSGIRQRQSSSISHDVEPGRGYASASTSPIRASALDDRYQPSAFVFTIDPGGDTRTDGNGGFGLGINNATSDTPITTRSSFDAYRSTTRSDWTFPSSARSDTRFTGRRAGDEQVGGRGSTHFTAGYQVHEEPEEMDTSTNMAPSSKAPHRNDGGHPSRPQHSAMSMSMQLPVDPNNLLPLSVPPSPQPTPPISRRPSPNGLIGLSGSGHFSDTGSTGTGGYTSAGGRYFDASPRTSSVGDGGRPQLMALDMGWVGGGGGGGSTPGNSSAESDSEEAMLTAVPGGSKGSVGRKFVGASAFWGWPLGSSHRQVYEVPAVAKRDGSRTESFATAGSSISADSSSSHAPTVSWQQSDVSSMAKGATDVISSEILRSKRKWRRWLAWARRRAGLGGYAIAAQEERSDRNGLGAAGQESSIRHGPVRLTQSESGSSNGMRKKPRRRTYDVSTRSAARYATSRRQKGFLANGFGLDLGVGDAEWLDWVGSLIPVQPWSILFVLTLLIAFAIGLTLTLIHILNPDKEPLPWREYCQADYPRYFALQLPTKLSPLTAGIEEVQPAEEDPRYVTLPAVSPDYLLPINATSAAWPFHPHESIPWSAEDESVDELDPVGIFLAIFTTDAGLERRNLIRRTYGSHRRSRVNGTEGVTLRFVMGQPRPKFERLVKLEMEAFDDILLLDMTENMNAGKTHAFFSWASENATVPDYEWVETRRNPALEHSSMHPPLPRRTYAQDGMAMLNQLNGVTLDGEDSPWDQVDADEELPAHVNLQQQHVLKSVYRGEKRPDYVVKADEDSFIMLGELERRLRVLPRKMTYWGYLIRNVFMAGECYGLSMDLVDYIAKSSTLRSYTRGKEDKLVGRWMRMHPDRENIVWASERCSIYDHPKSGTVYAHGFLFPSEVSAVRQENITALPPSDISLRGGLSQASAYSTVSRFKHAYRPPQVSMSAAEEIEALIEGSELSTAARHAGAQNPQPKAKERPSLSLEEIAEAYRRRPTRMDRFNGDVKERGGTAVIHFIKRQDWFLETALALLGSPRDQREDERGQQGNTNEKAIAGEL